jgi:hypothetical protein
MYDLRKHQIESLQKTIDNNFQSGVHFHATGTGKSLIALNILLKYHKKYPTRNILWLCEQKSILYDLFNNEKINNFIISNISNSTNIINLINKQNPNFIQDLNNLDNSNKIFNYFLIVNRAYLTYSNRYQNLNNIPGLVIHDECHSINNKSTQSLLDFFQKFGTSIIGFSATPEFIGPYKNIISEYSIYSAFCDSIILSPKILWFDNNKNIIENISYIIHTELYYKKIIVWCGLIDYSNDLLQIWKQYFNNFLFAIDTSKITKNLKEFYEIESNAILFCAAKHREGSDIKNLDCCIFMDLVSERTSKTFIQCIGRVLRKDESHNKKNGIIIDYKARSVGEVLSRLNKYIHADTFPWDYKKLFINKTKSNYYQLELIKTETNISHIELNTTRDTIIKLFKRQIINENIYTQRLNNELNLIESKNLFSYLLQAIKILELTYDIPHVTRGSCGSSLVCYLLGISNVDPVKYNIKFSRFLNEYRNNLPDIDFDFPHYKRDEVFIRISKKWPNQIARISNHIHFHKKSAEREALRKLGYHSFIDKYSVQKIISKLSIAEKLKFEKIVNELEGTFRTYSLHCGGIVFYPDGVPSELKINNGLIDQVNLDKRDISKEKNFKIDILSSKGISQLHMYYSSIGKKLSFTHTMTNRKVFEIFKNGDNIGITLAESPLIRKTFLMFKPESIEDLAICLSVIRPIARESRKEGKVQGLIYDDDAIDLIKDYFNVSEDYADKLRREFSKKNFDSLKKLNEENEYDKLPDSLKELDMYSFCKAHAMSYAQLIYKLAEFKLENPTEFWKSTLINCTSSYKKWVHPYEASKVNAHYIETKEKSIYCKNTCILEDGPIDQLKKSGMWSFKDYSFIPNCYLVKRLVNGNSLYYFSGLIAHIRVLSITSKKKSLVCLICSGKDYFEVNTIGNFYFSPKSYMLTGVARLDCQITKSYTAKSFKYIV